MRLLCGLAVALLAAACKHPLAIVGEGDIVDANGTRYGCTYIQYIQGSSLCHENPIWGEYVVRYEPVPAPGWRFVRWEGMPCGHYSVHPYCEFRFTDEQVKSFNVSYRDFKSPPTIAVFEQFDVDGDGIPDTEDEFPHNPTEWIDSDRDGIGDNADDFPNDPRYSGDVDNDGVADNLDAFPNDPTESADEDCDGVGDNSDRSILRNITTLLGDRCGPGVHLYLLAEGYTAAEQAKLRSDARRFSSALLDDPGVADFIRHWNVHSIETVSSESGIDEEYGVDTVNSFFGTGFNCGGIQRSMCTDEGKVFREVYKFTNDSDPLVLMMINTTEYGGTANAFLALFSAAHPEIALHEIGHNFADLGDEYVDEEVVEVRSPTFTEGVSANLSRFSTPGLVPWSHWIDNHSNYPTEPGAPGVGIFEGGFYHATGFYRPTYRSKMWFSEFDFGPVNSEAMILESYRRTGAVTAHHPQQSRLDVYPGDPVRLSIEPSYDAGVQVIEWSVNGRSESQRRNKDFFIFERMIPGEYRAKVAVRDITGAVRKDSDGVTVFEKTWTIDVVAP